MRSDPCDSNPQPSAHPQRGIDTLYESSKRCAERAALLAGLAYGLGYASRALHAFDYNFGALPGARFEYLVAGVLLLLPIAALVGTLWALREVVRALMRWSERNRGQSEFLRKSVLAPMMPLSMLIFGLGRTLDVLQTREWVAWLGISGMLLSIGLGAILAAPDEQRPIEPGGSAHRTVFGRIAHAITIFLGYLFTAYIALFMLMLFVLATFVGAYLLQFVPQEFGGVSPKCAVLDLEREQLSPELASLLMESPAQARIVRSRRLAVFSTTGPWLIRIADPGANSVIRRSIRLSDDAVHSVEWIGPGTPRPATGGSDCAPNP